MFLGENLGCLEEACYQKCQKGKFGSIKLQNVDRNDMNKVKEMIPKLQKTVIW